MDDSIEINRRVWDERAAIHAHDTTGFYSLDLFRAGESALHGIEAAELAMSAASGSSICSTISGWTRSAWRDSAPSRPGWISPLQQ